MNSVQQQPNQPTAEGSSSDRRWQWSKESNGLIEKVQRKKKQKQPAINPVAPENEEESVVYEAPQSEQTSLSKFEKKLSTPSIISTETKNEPNIIIKSKTPNEEHTVTDEFFDNGPYSNPEEAIAKKSSTA